MQIYVDDVSFAFCGGSTKRIFDGWILWTGKSRTIIEYIHEYKQLQFKVLINTKNRYLVHICFDVCNVYKKLHWWRSLQSITFVLCAPEKKLGTKCLFIKFSKGSNSLARYLIRFMSFLMVEFFELANQEQSLNTFMNTNNYNSKFW